MIVRAPVEELKTLKTFEPNAKGSWRVHGA